METKSEIMEDSKVFQTNNEDIEGLDPVRSALDPAEAPEEYFPDGGLKAWCTVAGGFLSFIATIGFLSGGSVFQSYFMTTKLSTTSPDDIAWIGSVQIWGCFFFGIWSGRLSDKYGPRPLLATGGFFLVLGNMMSSLSSKYYQFLLSQGFCVALGMGLAFTPALAVQSQWFLRHRGFAVALVMSGQNLGGKYILSSLQIYSLLIRCFFPGVIWPVLANNLLNEKGMSLGWVLRIIAFMQLAMMIAATLLIQSRFPGGLPHDPLYFKKYFTDKRTSLFTLAMLILNLGVYIPWVSRISPMSTTRFANTAF